MNDDDFNVSIPTPEERAANHREIEALPIAKEQSIHRFKSGLICDYEIIRGDKRTHDQPASEDECNVVTAYFVKENSVPVNCVDVVDMLEKTLGIPIWEEIANRILEER